MRRILLIFLLSACTLNLSAAASESATFSLKSGNALAWQPGLFKRMIANSNFRQGNFYKAASLYELCFEKDPYDAELNFKMGLCYLNLHSFDKALDAFGRARAGAYSDLAEISLNCGKAYLGKFRLDSAAQQFQLFKNIAVKRRIEKEKVDALLLQCDYTRMCMFDSEYVRIRNAGVELNSDYADYSPHLDDDGKKIYFTSRRESTTGGMRDMKDHQFYEDVYTSTYDDNLKAWTVPHSVSEFINSVGHDASAGIRNDGEALYIYKNVNGGDLYMSKLASDGAWFMPTAEAFRNINSTASESSVSITADGKTMYFVSERPGGFGKGDIYKSELNPDSTWGIPVHLDSLINTPEDEVAVSVAPDGKTMYFSSKGHAGMGGYDIFKSQLKNGSWLKAVNMGYPINSPNDDIGYFPVPKTNSAWFASVRAENYGNLDLYIAQFPPFFDEFGELTDENPKPDKFVERQVLTGRVLDDDENGINAEILVKNTFNGKELPPFITDSAGFFRVEPTGFDLKNIRVTAFKTGYKVGGFHKVSFREDQDAHLTTYTHTIHMQKVEPDSTDLFLNTLSVVNKNGQIVDPAVSELNRQLDADQNVVVFDFNSASVHLENGKNAKLDAIALQMKRNKNLYVELEGHTDIIGTEAYNMHLSLVRAFSVANYLIKKGINPKRIKAFGMGTANPIASNETEEGRRTNRRVEIRLK